MGFFRSLFRAFIPSSDDSDDNGSSVSVREKNADRSVVRGDKYSYTEDDKSKHSHDSYSLDRTTGQYKEYHGGENSDDRSHNK